jgi:hypothetical protein
MSGERLERLKAWIWPINAAFAALCLLLLVTSQTVSGRVFSMMLVVAQAFTIWFVRTAAARKDDVPPGPPDDGIAPGR